MRCIPTIDPTLLTWQHGFHDLVVRTDLEADAWRRHIASNSATWGPAADRTDGHHA